MQAAISSVHGAFDRFNHLHVQWHIGNYCNYRCSYCNDALRDGTSPFVPIDIARRVVDNITRQLEGTSKRAEFTLSGGEPTVYEDLEPLLQHMHARDAYSHMITNGSRSVAYYRRIAPLLTHGVIFTFHSDHAKLDKFCRVVEVFDPRLVTIYIPMNIALWDKCVEAYDRLTAMGVRAIPKTVFEDFGNGGANTVVAYSREQREYIRDKAVQTMNAPIGAAVDRDVARPLMLAPKAPAKSGLNYRTIEIRRSDGAIEYTTPQKLIISRQNDFRGMQCNAGIDFLLIGYSGSVFRANCQRQVLANIYRQPEFELPAAPIVCDVPLCWCEGDILINKYQ